MTAEYLIYRRARGLERGVVETTPSEYRSVACRDQKHIALAEWDLEALAEMQHHLARGVRLAGFEETQVSCRNLYIERQIELGLVPTLAPFADVATDVTGLDSGVLHGCNVAC
jgi:hypothetical protein